MDDGESVGAPTFQQVDDVGILRWRRLSIRGHTGRHPGPSVPSLEERESTLAVWVSRARGSVNRAQKGGSQGGWPHKSSLLGLPAELAR